jgi:hypothetical protein
MQKLDKVYSVKDGVLFKSVRESIHFLRKPPAICIDLRIFQRNQARIKYIQVYEKEKGIYYTARIIDFVEKGFIINRGYGDQIALLIQYWKKSYIPDIVPEIFEDKKQNRDKKEDFPQNKTKQLSILEL